MNFCKHWIACLVACEPELYQLEQAKEWMLWRSSSYKVLVRLQTRISSCSLGLKKSMKEIFAQRSDQKIEVRADSHQINLLS